MLIVALVLAVIALAALVTAVVTSNEVIAWVCIGASVLGVVLLIVDAVRERSGQRATPAPEEEEPQAEFDAEYPDDAPAGEGVDQSVDETARTVPADTSVEKTGDTGQRVEETAGEEPGR